MTRLFAALLAAGLVTLPVASHAAHSANGDGGAGSVRSSGDGGNGQDGGDGTVEGHADGNGTSTMPGCDGGTDPSPDGKFTVPGTTQACNPSDDDRRKLK